MRRFEFTEGTSSKFWEADLSGTELKLAWGRIGTAGQTKSLSFPSPAAANAEYEKRVVGKLSEGYVERGVSGRAAPVTPSPSTTTTTTVEDYETEAREIWKRYVPRSGQADTVQGELLRAVNKLRDEAHRNGNGNWDEGHEILARFLRDTLVSSGLFPSQTSKAVAQDVVRVLDYERPYTDDDLFDRLTARVVDWSRAHPDPVAHTRNPKLQR